MREVREWNNDPREMWVWNDNSSEKRKAFVVYFNFEKDIRVIALNETVIGTNPVTSVYTFDHCAEIDDSGKRYMTNKELAQWLSLKFDREYLSAHGVVSHTFAYRDRDSDVEIDENIFIREGNEPWRIPVYEE